MELVIVVILYVLWVVLPFMLLSGNLKFVIFIVILSLVLLVFSLILKIRNKKKKGTPFKLSKKFRDKYPIVIQYTPPKGVNSAEAGLLYNCRVEPTDLTSLIYQWAYQGLIQIEDGDNSEDMIKVVLKKLKEIPEDRPFFEKDMFDSIFMGGRDTKVISSSNQLKYALFLEDLQIHGMQKGWFEKKKIPLFIKILYALLIISTILSIFIEIWLFPIMLLLLIVMSGYIFGDEKMQLTDKGAELVSYIIGYRKFIKECDEKQIKTFLDDDPFFVDKSLPYAIAFGLDSQFINKTTPLAEDWNSKYLFGKKLSPLGEIIAGMALNSDSSFWFSWLDFLRLLFKF